MSENRPAYLRIKHWILEGIEQGRFGPGSKIPSENVLAETFGVSRMTANRAIQELAMAHVLRRIQGSGTYVATPEIDASLTTLTSIQLDLAHRGHRHSASVLQLSWRTVPERYASLLVDLHQHPVAYCEIVHADGELPIQLERRYVAPPYADAFMRQNFSKSTPTEYLSLVAPLQRAEYSIYAMAPTAEFRQLLQLDAGEPILHLHRATWSQGNFVTVADLYHPASRYHLRGTLNYEETL
jgi:GntR family histidine utilization transcriptional repressor